MIVSDSNELKTPYIVDLEEKKVIKKIFNGKRINIAVTGVDSRIGERYRHADANHIISLLLETGQIEIYSVPRDTYAYAGFDEDSLDRFNLLTNVLGRLGRKKYLEELSKITDIDHIHYYVELGFSQAIGIIEKLGFKDPKSTLQVLRDRKSYRIGDFQRSYNQGKFIKGSILKFNQLAKDTDLLYDIFLGLVETNLSKSDLLGLVSHFENISKNSIQNFVKPKINTNFEEIDLFNSSKLDSIIISKNLGAFDNTSEFVASKLLEILDEVENNSNNQIKINKLKRYFDQKAWLQISDLRIRSAVKNRFKDILAQAYTDIGKYKEAQKIISSDYN
jgi:anionic cell wall polymer biosynthesis LytR-Cps2A-Psr (LCP) family protein